jgi:hypothetical protein
MFKIVLEREGRRRWDGGYATIYAALARASVLTRLLDSTGWRAVIMCPDGERVVLD